MKDYKRLTKKIEGIWTVKDEYGYTLSFFDKTTNKVVERLAELEDKIENGTLIEFPRIMFVGYLNLWCVEYPNKKYGTIVIDFFGNKAEAEAKLKELQGEEK